MEQYRTKEPGADESFRLTDLMKIHVLTHSGEKLGKVQDVHVDEDDAHFTGITVKRGVGKSEVFVGRSYIASITDKSVILNIDPLLTHVGKKVITKDGKVIGVVKEVERHAQTNKLEALIIRHLWKTVRIDKDQIQLIETNVVLKKEHEDAKQLLKKSA